LPALTGFRFVLAMWVIMHHLTGKGMLLAAWSGSLPEVAQGLLHGGYLAVQTFFLLSGFVLARSYASTKWNRESVMRFAVARFARIYPAYFLSLIVVSWFALLFLLKPGHSVLQKAGVLGDYAFILQGWKGSLGVGWNTPAWSLSCEFFFYLCFPLLFLWLRRGGVVRICAALGISFVAPMLLARTSMPPYWKPIHHLSDFVAGIAAAGLYSAIAGKGGIKRLAAWLYLPALAAGAAFIVYPQVLNGTPMNLNTVLRPLNVAILVGLALGDGFVARLLSGDVAGYLGKVSYSMYILHIPLLWWYSALTFHFFGAVPPAWTGFLYLALVMATSVAAFEFVEDPANIRIRDWAAARIQPAQPVPLRAAA
jgi:peptidoglycan/LPS O-acetylase OafA/YrhL